MPHNKAFRQGSVNTVRDISCAPNIESQIRQLDRYITRLDEESSRLRSERFAISRSVRKASRQFGYLRFVRWFRSPAAHFELWPFAVLAVGPVVCGGILIVFAYLIFEWLPLALAAFAFGAVVSAGTFWNFLHHPKTRLLDTAIEFAGRELDGKTQQREPISQRLKAVTKALKTRHRQRNDLISSAQYQRELLLQRDWKAMRDKELEEYLDEICRALGGTIETTKAVRDQGVDLIVQFGSRRIAIQAKGYHNSVGNSAVQQVVAGMIHYACDGCAVITNSRFTASAIELAESNGCALISEDGFPDFVMGNTPL